MFILSIASSLPFQNILEILLQNQPSRLDFALVILFVFEIFVTH